jgi:hypothetical protein
MLERLKTTLAILGIVAVVIGCLFAVVVIDRLIFGAHAKESELHRVLECIAAIWLVSVTYHRILERLPDRYSGRTPLMTGGFHSHICPSCGFEWDHENPDCDLRESSDCEECLVHSIYWVEQDILDSEGNMISTSMFYSPGPADREPALNEVQLMKITGFRSLREMDQHYSARVGQPSRSTHLPKIAPE